jgi:hypothetical protein
LLSSTSQALNISDALNFRSDLTMYSIAIYCKSYRNDVLRARKLVESIREFNREKLPFFISVPSEDLALFREQLAGFSIEFVSDEEIIRSNSALDWEKIAALPGWNSQQIVKSEFWRLELSDTYLCIDSDCQFIRSFGESDFLTPEGYPYTVMHEAKELLQYAVNNKQEKTYEQFHRERLELMNFFGRKGKPFDYGPPPMIWSSHVWRSLDEQLLKPRGMNFYDAILKFPSELLWYGEAMLNFLPFPLIPVEPLFKFYHYEHQYVLGCRSGDSIENLSKNFLGVCYQSNWNEGIDFSRKSKPLLSRAWRSFRKKVLGRHV